MEPGPGENGKTTWAARGGLLRSHRPDAAPPQPTPGGRASSRPPAPPGHRRSAQPLTPARRAHLVPGRSWGAGIYLPRAVASGSRRDPDDKSVRWGFFGGRLLLLAAVVRGGIAPLELLDTTPRVDQLLATGEERMALVA